MSEYLPGHLSEAHVFINHEGTPTMSALWNGEPWLFYWKDDPPTWVSYLDLSQRKGVWAALHSPRWQQKWLSEARADLYHKMAFPPLGRTALVETNGAVARRELSGRQRNVIVISMSIANDMDCNGTVAEQHTAALLRLVADAVERGYEAELVLTARAWAVEREGNHG